MFRRTNHANAGSVPPRGLNPSERGINAMLHKTASDINPHD